MPSPAERQVNDLPRSGDTVQGLERLQDDRTLLPDIARFTERVTEGPLYEDGARRLHFFGELTHNRDPDGGNPDFFDLSLDQSHGLIADPSGGRQQNDIDPVLSQLLCNLPGRGGDQGGDVPAIDMTHEGIVALSQFTNHALLL